MNNEISRKGFKDADGTRWISITEAVVRYRCDPDKLKLLVSQGELNHRCISVEGRATHFVEDAKFLVRLKNDDGASWARDFVNIGVAAVSGAVATEYVGDWFDEESLPQDQVASVLAELVNRELLANCIPWPNFGKLFDPGQNRIVEIHSLGADLDYFLANGRSEHFSKADFLAYARFKKSFHVYADTVSMMGLQAWSQPCKNPACSGQHYLLDTNFLLQHIPDYTDGQGTPLPDYAFAMDFVKYVGVAPTSVHEIAT